jgi:hypothetical protein
VGILWHFLKQKKKYILKNNQPLFVLDRTGGFANIMSDILRTIKKEPICSLKSSSFDIDYFPRNVNGLHFY